MAAIMSRRWRRVSGRAGRLAVDDSGKAGGAGAVGEMRVSIVRPGEGAEGRGARV